MADRTQRRMVRVHPVHELHVFTCGEAVDAIPVLTDRLDSIGERHDGVVIRVELVHGALMQLRQLERDAAGFLRPSAWRWRPSG